MRTIEEWRSVPGEPLLLASSWGRVRSVPYETPMPYGGFKINEMRPTYGTFAKDTKRFITVFRRKTYRIAPLVCAAFHGPRPEGLVASHQDECSRNNSALNLKWDTQKGNMNMPKVKEYHRQACRAKMNSKKILLD